MKISFDTLSMLADELGCSEADKILDNFVNASCVAYGKSHLTTNDSKKTYFNFHSFNGKLFLETETRIVPKKNA